jgi:hypothetical protein
MLKGNKTVCGKLISELKNGSDKKVELMCDNCSKITITTYNNYTLSQRKNGFTGFTICRSCNSKNQGYKNKGKKPPNKGKKFPELSGENSPVWKGGKFISSDGYMMINVGNNDSNIGWKSYKKEHIHLIEQNINRKLEQNEEIHHINGNKLDNDISNLFLTNKSDHRKIHNSLRDIGYKLYEAGLIFFDKKTQTYQADDKLRELLENPNKGNQQPS